MPNETREIQLTPNYAAMFNAFINDADNAGDAKRLFKGFQHEAALLRAMQRVLAPLNVAAQCMTTVENVNRLREVLARITEDIDNHAGTLELENDTAEDCDAPGCF